MNSELSVLLLGHGYCIQCSDRLFSEGNSKCPACRATLRRRDGHPVYLELVDSSDSSGRQEDKTDALRTEVYRANSDRDYLWKNWAESLQTTIGQLTLSLQEAESNTNAVIHLAETTKLELENVLGESVFWRKRVEELDLQKARLEDRLERYIDNAHHEKQKNEKLSRQVAFLTQRHEEEETDAYSDIDYSSFAYSHMAVVWRR
ncbi:hypothetical protein GALMADRAFT_161984 [Galerina marginata CBS 339.88]|uniref:Uncharacterized protein n=1 Tax=Galerina marginata (strain CBS 339.88) TaxID=685588 RepID=A0A067S9E4_GALM3|nr:hypothetical protein GALMADRAFT_161984 [Galerina marginata CBS 339.88]